MDFCVFVLLIVSADLIPEISESEALKEIKALEAASESIPLHGMPASDFLFMGLELEESQYEKSIR